MSKKEKAAPQNGTTKLEPGQHITKYELVATHLLEQGAQGVSALSGLAGLHDLNLRNSIGLIRRNHGIAIADAFFDHQHSGGGTTRFKRYWLADREQAHKLVALINHWRRQRQAAPLADDYAAIMCARAPEAATLPPAA
ncbi:MULTISPECIES: hypothetical protein [Aeromonas]|jgi:hypothetical protein|uniref:Rha family transcriptional regulator n=1 Tax=Aeromonas caviae TaxID=648 RepID=A0AAW9FBL5_AERCA|nr:MULTISPECIES: hypothetical protein [Aeromonas]MBP4033278.1 hypothetical protein [Aeromonas sp. PrichA-15]MDX7723394.1 hypothetical protein [Aeromonas caviae]